jgi:cytochrome c-type biogenesis protein CcmH/NrfG
VPKESVVFGIAGVFFGILVGWMIGSQQARPPAATTTAPAAAAAQQAQTAPPFDQSRASALEATIAKNGSDVESRVQLGDLYFDAERFADATKWYEDALRINPKHVNASTDLGIAYYYMNQPDRALQQFDRSLAVDPKHTKTLLNVGIVRAFGKQDLEGAAKAWQQVIDIAPTSQEAAMARKAIEGLRSAHPEGGSSTPPPAAGQPGK